MYIYETQLCVYTKLQHVCILLRHDVRQDMMSYKAQLCIYAELNHVVSYQNMTYVKTRLSYQIE